MRRAALHSLVVVCLVVLAGCATGGQTTTSTSPPTATTTTTDSSQPTTATTGQTTVPSGNRVPLSLSNRNSSAHNVTLVVTNGTTTTTFNGTIHLGPAGTPNATEQNVTLLSEQGTTYNITATTDEATLKTNVTLTYGVLEEQIDVTTSGDLEYREVIN